MPNQNCHSARLYPPGRTAKSNLLFLSLTALLSGIQPVSVCAAESDIELHLPAQPLAAALEAYSQDTGIQLIYRPEAVAGLQSPALDGRFTRTEALGRLLKGTTLSVQPVDDHTLAIKSVEQGVNNTKQSIDAITLPKVNVVGNAINDTTDPYNKDYALPNATTGTKTDTPLMETPLNVQVISKQVLKDQQVISLADALKNVSGVTAADQAQSGGTDGGIGTSQTYFIRGFASTTFLRNGFRMTQGGGVRQMANTESVEVLKGSAAILYGQVEPGGMINIITKQPQTTPYYAASQQFGSYDLYRTSIDATGPITSDDTLLYRLNMSYQNSGSFREFVGSEDVYLAPVLKWNIDPKTQMTLELEYNRSHQGLGISYVPMQFDTSFTPVPRGRNFGEYSPGTSETFFGSFNWSHKFNDDWMLKHRFSVNQQQDNVYLIAPRIIADNTATRVHVGGFSGYNTYTNNLDLLGHFDTYGLKHTLLLGGDHYRLDGNSISAAGFTGLDTPEFSTIDVNNPVHPGPLFTQPLQNYQTIKTKTDQFGLYAQDQIKLPYNFHALLGVRYQYFNQLSSTSYNQNIYDFTPDSSSALTQTAVTPRYGLLWKAQDWLSLYMNFTESFGPNSGLVYPGKSIKASSAYQYEGGLKTEFFDGRLRTSFAYFDITKTHITAQDLIHQGAGGAFPFSIDIGKAKTTGPEFDLQGEILPGWNFIGNYAHINAHIINPDGSVGGRLWNQPRNVGNVWTTFEIQNGDFKSLTFGGGVNMQDGQQSCCDGSLHFPGYATVSLMTGYEMKLGKTKLNAQININNLLDKNYFTAIGTSAGQGYAIVDYVNPRSVMASIGIQY
ncbi:TonB-dependent receptor [Methylomonas sp. AM2-LC]|uniref:TonB-dependent siderophore receptor n=1 Tax=Methylomonas sp. AM2-LC TaxID=3153301 RepID=UPI003263C1C1